MRAVITVIGQDKVGIIAKISNILADASVNVLDISQTIMQELFTMMMLVDISKSTTEFGVLAGQLRDLGNELELSIQIQHEDIFQSMHRV